MRQRDQIMINKISSALASFLIMYSAFGQTSQEQEIKVLSVSDSPSGPVGDAIRHGYKILTETRAMLPTNVGNGLNCTSCHLNGGTKPHAAPWAGLWGVFPAYSARAAKVITLADRVNDCFERSMNGKAIAYDSMEMTSILSYMQFISTGVPTGSNAKGRGEGKIDQNLIPDAVKGKTVYAEKCAACHGANGLGLKGEPNKYVFPPLWGEDSFNDGAGMARPYTAASFVIANMPLGLDNSLTQQEALDVSQYFTHQTRPVYPGKQNDWPQGGRPKDAR